MATQDEILAKYQAIAEKSAAADPPKAAGSEQDAIFEKYLKMAPAAHKKSVAAPAQSVVSPEDARARRDAGPGVSAPCRPCSSSPRR